jgi:hypothetical protein
MSRYQSRNSSSSSLQDKANYDDLIDEYAAPYARQSQHQTVAIQPPSLSYSSSTHRRGPSFPLSLDNSSYTDMSHKPKASVGTALDWGYPPNAPVKEPEKATFWQKILPDSLYCKLYVLTVVVQTIIDLAIEGDLLLRFHQATEHGQLSNNDDVTSRKMPVYLSIFVIAHVFQFVMALDAVYARNTLQFTALTGFNFLFLVYAVIQINEIRHSLLPGPTGVLSDIPISVLTTVLPCVIAVAEIAYIALGWKIYQEFGWKVYKFLGADRQIKKMYAHFQIFECLLKFDVFFFVGFSVEFIFLVLQKDDWERYLTVAALPVSLILLVEGVLAARHESKWMMITFMTGCSSAMIYFVYKLARVLTKKNLETYALIWKSLTTFSIISIILLLITFVFACIVMHNFGRGLKTQLAKQKPIVAGGLKRKGTEYVHRGPMRTHPNRMSID